MVAIPGPSILPDAVRTALARPMPDIYDGALVDLAFGVLGRLPAIARTSGNAFVVASNGHGAWQMAISNTIARGDKVLALESGRFAVFWGAAAGLAGAEVEILPGDFHSPVDPDALEARLRADSGKSIKAILVSHVDTSSSVHNDIPALRAAIDAADHPALLMVDCIASLGCDRYEMDDWGVDLTVGASQKGMMCPPGLGFVWAGERAVAAMDPDRPRSSYLDWEKRLDPQMFYEIFSGTPPVAHLHALEAALDLIDDEGGLEAVWARHRVHADAVRAAVEAWHATDGLSLNIASPRHRSNAVTTVQTGEIDAVELRRRCAEQTGLTLGIGMVTMPDRTFRIGHMGWHNPPMILGVLATIEAALHSMGAPMASSGVAAATAVIGEALDEGAKPDQTGSEGNR